MDATKSDIAVAAKRPFRLGDFARNQLRNIAPFITLLFLVLFFSIASPSFATLDNLENILQQVSVTGIIAVGLTFVILTAEIDLSVGAIANATAHRADLLHAAARLREHRQHPDARRHRDHVRARSPASRSGSSPPSASPASASLPSS